MSKLTILLVDDEPEILKLLQRMMHSWGFDSIAVDSGEKAVRIIEEKKADMVILDYRMPDMDGVDTLKEIRRQDPLIPVIMFTSFPDEKILKSKEELNISACIPKESLNFCVQCTALRIVVEEEAERVKMRKGEV